MLSVFFFFKQKTAYDMRISDWSSDVCSSDLEPRERAGGADFALEREDGSLACCRGAADRGGEVEVLSFARKPQRHLGGIRGDLAGESRGERTGRRLQDGFGIRQHDLRQRRQMRALRWSAVRAACTVTAAACQSRSEDRRVRKTCVSTTRSPWT